MLAFPLYFLRSFAYAGIAVVGFAAIAALAILPAVITLLGDRLESLDVRAALRRLRHRPPAPPVPVEATFWYRFAQGAMRRAVPVTLVVVAGLVVLGLPFTHVKFGFPDQRVLPSSASAYQVGQDVDNNFPSQSFGTINVVVPQLGSGPNEIGGYAKRLSQVTGVSAVQSVAGQYVSGSRVAAGTPSMLSGGASYLVLHDAADPQSTAAKQTLSAVKAVPAPWPVWYGGQTAENEDSLHAISAPLPYVIGLIALATFILLFMFTGSLLMPVKALVLNTLSLTATFGAMVWIFQEGHLGWAYPNLTTTGYLTSTMPPLMFCVAFGLSMDYEIFLLSRIREEWLASGKTTADNAHAVAVGLGRTGRIVTAAAVLMAIVFAAISRAHVAFMMLFGTGLTLAVLMDATIVRGTLVPAFMRLAGRWNWWAPAPLARLHARIGLSDEPSTPAHEPEPVAVG
jgi:RND superfamily putative drug exporter